MRIKTESVKECFEKAGRKQYESETGVASCVTGSLLSVSVFQRNLNTTGRAVICVTDWNSVHLHCRAPCL